MAIDQKLLAKALMAAGNAVVITNRDGHVVWVNQAFTRLSGYTFDEITEKSLRLLKSGHHSERFYRGMWQTILRGEIWQGELVERGKSGEIYFIEQTITPLVDESGNITHFMAIQYDITRRKHEIEQVRQMAYHDTLTGLPNRAFFGEQLRFEMTAADTERHTLALLYLDLDLFKEVNDALGHYVGDLLLKAVAERLRAAVRESDTVARLGGDEFAIIQARVTGLDVATALAQKLITSLSKPYMLNSHYVRIGISIGIALHQGRPVEADTLLMNADLAMYQAKHHGRNRFYVFSEQQPYLLTPQKTTK